MMTVAILSPPVLLPSSSLSAFLWCLRGFLPWKSHVVQHRQSGHGSEARGYWGTDTSVHIWRLSTSAPNLIILLNFPHTLYTLAYPTAPKITYYRNEKASKVKPPVFHFHSSFRNFSIRNSILYELCSHAVMSICITVTQSSNLYTHSQPVTDTLPKLSHRRQNTGTLWTEIREE